MGWPRQLILIAMFLLPWCLAYPAPLFGQAEAEEELTTSPPGGTAVEEPGIAEPGEVLPEGLQTWESFEGTESITPVIGPTAVDYFRILAGLIVVIVVIWLLSLLLKRFVTVRGLAGTSESLKVLYTLNLSPTRTLYLVRLGDRVLLVGAGEGGLRTLAELDDPLEVSQVLQELDFKGNFDLNPFRERLSSLMGAGAPESELEEDLNLRQRKLKQALDRLKDVGGNEG